MLPFSAYIMIENPVDHCGCFGDFWVISNSATFYKNLAITIGLVYLCFFNKRTFGLFLPYVQWIVATICYIYILAIGIIGYNIQPLIDFRQYKVGTSLISQNDSIGSEPQFDFIYEKNGKKQTFKIDNLPDSTWNFVDRIEVKSDSTTTHGINIYDLQDNDVTTNVISSSGEQLIILFPEIEYADISYSFMTNEMYNYISKRGGDMIGIFAFNDKDKIKNWLDRSLTIWPTYIAEDTSIKEIARGKVSVVYLKDGIIKWKRTLSSIPTDIFSSKDDKENALDKLYPSNKYDITYLTQIFKWTILVIFSINIFFATLIFLFSRINKKKNVTLQKETTEK